MFVNVPAVKTRDLINLPVGEDSDLIRNRVQKARDKQTRRFKDFDLTSNSEMSSRQVKEVCRLDEECKKLLAAAINRFQISARGYVRILKVARTIADLEAAEEIKPNHLAEAIQYRAAES
jgi:magnesium chelatase family protein